MLRVSPALEAGPSKTIKNLGIGSGSCPLTLEGSGQARFRNGGFRTWHLSEVAFSTCLEFGRWAEGCDGPAIDRARKTETKISVRWLLRSRRFGYLCSDFPYIFGYVKWVQRARAISGSFGTRATKKHLRWLLSRCATCAGSQCCAPWREEVGIDHVFDP